MATTNTTTCIVDGPPAATTACIVQPFTFPWPPAPQMPQLVPITVHGFPPARLSDEDVERIARRVVELMSAAKAP